MDFMDCDREEKRREEKRREEKKVIVIMEDNFLQGTSTEHFRP
jgi:hypothetical protein